ncbi:MAG: hybrid sensor histidine kinase/response regulator, partial [Proteobacteria bacterium]
DRSAGGLGIGLALVKSLVELHGGSVVAESQGVGYGSRFTVTLPRLMASSSDSQVPPAPAETRERLSANASARAPVLIVDDNRDAAETMGMLVESLGYEPVVEFHPVRALERLSTLTPKVCLLDIGLPDMSGYELAQEIRKRLAPAPVTLIGITGYGQPQDREEALRAGFDAHFVKPVESDALAGFLSSLQDLPESSRPSSTSRS